jgi:hypothetical protein
VIALALCLLQAASPGPAPTPSATPTPVSSRARTLSDVARERRIGKEKAADASKPARAGSLTVLPKKPDGEADVPATAVSVDGAPPDDRHARLVVESAAHNGVVDSGGQVQVFGKLRNGGNAPACDVSLTVRIYDDRGAYLASAVVRADEGVIAPNGVASFTALLKAPPGVAGSIRDKVLGYGTTGAGATLEGQWRMLGDRVDVDVTTYSERCAGPKDGGKGPAD